MTLITRGVGPHAGRPVATAGAPLDGATAALILVHGRGGDAAEMLELARLVASSFVMCLAPPAAGHTWYPQRFTEPTSRNEPDLSSALSVLGGLADDLVAGGLPEGRIALLGFSQGACLALEFALRSGRRLGAVLGLSGGLIGAAVAAPGDVGRPFEGMPVLLGCSERDPHVPLTRVRETETILQRLGAAVTKRVYPGAGHTINADELEIARGILTRMAAP